MKESYECPNCGQNLNGFARKYLKLVAENKKLTRRVTELEGQIGYWGAGKLVASQKKNTFHRAQCRWAMYIYQSPNLLKFSSREEAVEAGYRPCKTCCA